MNRRPLIIRRLSRFARGAWTVMACALWALIQTPLAAQSFWELSPYRIEVFVAVDPQAALGPNFESDLARGLAERADATIGAVWEVETHAAPVALRHQMLRVIDQVPAETFASQFEARDKIVLLTVAAEGDHYLLSACELDVPTRRWSLPATRTARQASELIDEAFRLWREVFVPTAKVSDVEGQTATLQLRGGALPPRDPAWRQVEMGGLFQPIVRRNARDGAPLPDGIEPVSWTFLTVGELQESAVRCSVHSGMRDPLSARRRGRTDLYALGVSPPRGTTLLELRARGDVEQPLPGYEIYSQPASGGAMELLGRTDRQGRLPIAASDPPLRVLYVKHGTKPLARLPMLPGLTERETAQIPDDDVRLQIEGQLVGLQENLLDVVARREVLFGRVRARLAAGDRPGAKELLDQVRRLPTQKEIALRIDQLEQTSVVPDKATQAEIGRMFQQTKSLLSKYLDVKQIDDLQMLIDKAPAASAAAR